MAVRIGKMENKAENIGHRRTSTPLTEVHSYRILFAKVLVCSAHMLIHFGYIHKVRTGIENLRNANIFSTLKCSHVFPECNRKSCVLNERNNTYLKLYLEPISENLWKN